jgi:hypothetical protein
MGVPNLMNISNVKLHENSSRGKWLSVTTAWRFLRLRMEERPPDMEGNCEYIE